jgi:hypothetical protein
MAPLAPSATAGAVPATVTAIAAGRRHGLVICISLLELTFDQLCKSLEHIFGYYHLRRNF